MAQLELMLARALREGPGLTLENAGGALREVGVDTSVPCPHPDFVSQGQLILMLDRAMNVPIYARFEQR